MCHNAVVACAQISEGTRRPVPVVLNKLCFVCIVLALRPGGLSTNCTNVSMLLCEQDIVLAVRLC